jgi:hypothetical protein
MLYILFKMYSDSLGRVWVKGGLIHVMLHTGIQNEHEG